MLISTKNRGDSDKPAALRWRGGCYSIIFRCTLVKTPKKALIFDFSFWCVFGCPYLIYIYIVFSFLYTTILFILLWKCVECGKVWKFS